MRALILVAILAGGCKKKEQPGPPLEAAASPRAPSATNEQDALWSLAPKGTTIGIVASARGVAQFERGMVAIINLVKSASELQSVQHDLESGLKQTFGIASPTLAKLGLSPDRGFALFIASGVEVVVLPVADRDKYLEMWHGTRGKDVDTITDYTCKVVKELYACTSTRAMLDHVGEDGAKGKLALAGARGDVEFVMDEAPVSIAAVAQLDHGAIVLRAALKGLPPIITAVLRDKVKPRVDPTTAAFAAVTPPLLAAMPALPIGQGVSLADIGGAAAGPLTVTSPAGAITLDLRMPLRDEAAAKKIIQHCSEFAPRDFGLSVDGNVCKLDAPPIHLEAWIANKELRIGKREDAPSGRMSPLSPIGAELAAGEWAFVFYGRGAIADGGSLASSLTGYSDEDERVGMRILTLVNEVGFGVRLDGDTVRMLALVRSAYSNPEPIVAKLISHTTIDLIRKHEVADSIAKLDPKSPWANDYGAGWTGAVIPGFAIAALVVFAGPLFEQLVPGLRDDELPAESPSR